MALWWDRLRTGSLWASGGQVADPTNEQANQGWSYVQDGKPSVEEFNSRDQWKDRADHWLWQQIAAVIGRAGRTPQETGAEQLADALRALGSVNPTVYGATGASGSADFIMPANYGRVLVVCTGAGGGSTLAYPTTPRTGAGGAGGGTAVGFYNIAPGTRVPVVIGARGSGGTAARANGTAGGSSSFGTYCSATGGGPGVWDGGLGVSGGLGGVGAGGFLNLVGGDGSDGHPTAEVTSGYGGATLFGGSRRAGQPKSGVFYGDGLWPGGGASPPWIPPGEGASSGGNGAIGMVMVTPVA